MRQVCLRGGRSGPARKILVFVLDAFVATTPRIFSPEGLELLSKRELDVVRQAAKGHTNSQIAGVLNLSEHTVKNHLLRVYNKLGLSNRVELLLCLLSQRRLIGFNGIEAVM